MKKPAVFIFAAAVSVLCAVSSVSAADIGIVIDGRVKRFDTEPINISGRVLLPVRATFEALGASVEWNGETSTAVAAKDGRTVSVSTGSDIMMIDGNSYQMDCASVISGDRMFIPVRFAAQAFGCSVEWDAPSATVNIHTYANPVYYPEANGIPTYDSVVPTAQPVGTDTDEDGITAYTYTSAYDDVTEYLMTLQNRFGFDHYDTSFGDDGTQTHIYTNEYMELVVAVSCGAESGQYRVSVVPYSYSEQRESSDSGRQNAEQDSGDVEYYENTNGTLPTYTSVVGTLLSEHKKDGDVDVYKYSGGFFEMSRYTAVITSEYGYRECDFEPGFGTITNYYEKDGKIVAAVCSLMTDEIWILVPTKN